MKVFWWHSKKWVQTANLAKYANATKPFFGYLVYFAVLREKLASVDLRPFRLGDQFAEGNTQGTGDGLGGVEIGAAFPAFQQADVSLVQARHFCHRRPAQLPLFAVLLDHL